MPGGKSRWRWKLPKSLSQGLNREFGEKNGTVIGVDHSRSGGNDGARLMVESVSGRISMWS